MLQTHLLLLFSLSLPFFISASSSTGYNITKILAKDPQFSTFNHYLTLTHLASEINRRRTITVLAVDNSGMSDLLSKHLTLPTLRNVLSLHILTDYYGAKKLHQLTDSSTTAASVFQSSGAAAGTSGYVNITDHRAGRVTFVANDAISGASPATFVKSIAEHPYDLAVLQISKILTSPEAEAPAVAPAPVNLTDVMNTKGCKGFASWLVALPEVLKIYEANLDTGLTVFCPDDDAVTEFEPFYKNLTAEGKSSLLLYHALPVYYSIQLLKQNNGIVTTLASEGKKRTFDYAVELAGEVVLLKTSLVKASITSTAIDQEPDAVFVIDKVLEPRELFKKAVIKDVEPPAEAPEPVADAPKPAKKKHKVAPHTKKAAPAADEEDAEAPAGPEEAPEDDDVADDKAAKAVGIKGSWTTVGVAVAGVVAGIVMG